MFPLVYFIRHGQTDWNAEGRLQGQADIDINAQGREQATRNGEHLASLVDRPQDFDFVASPMRRTRETMERVRTAMKLDPGGYRTDPRLVEVHFGDWQGSTFLELEARDPGSTAPRSKAKWLFVPPGKGAESYQMLLERVRPWFEALSVPTVCVTHGGIMRSIFKLVEGTPDKQAATREIYQDRILRYRDGKLEWL